MLSPQEEIHPKYLRVVRQVLRDIILPELTSPAGRNAVTLCDYILVRMIAAFEEVPSVQAHHQPHYLALLKDIQGGSAAPANGEEPLWSLARKLQDAVGQIGRALPQGQDADADRRRLAAIAKADASFRRDYESAAKRVEEKADPVPQALLVTAEKMQRYLDARFTGAGLKLTSCQQIPGGRSKITVLLGLEPNSRLPEGMVMRIDVPGSAIDTTVSDEFPIMEAMYRAGITAPEPLWLETDPRHFGAPFLVMRRMRGGAVGSLWGADDASPVVGLALAEALASVHRASYKEIFPAAPSDARGAVAQMLAEFEDSWRVGKSTPSLSMEGAFGWLNRHLSCIDGPTVVVHGDAHFANLLVEDDQLVCLIDWEFTHPGHPAEDLAYCRNYVEAIMPWNEFFAHYRKHGGYGVTDEQLRYFELWGPLRNITMGANMLRDILAGKIHGLQNLAIALNTRARLESILSKLVADALARDAATLSNPA